MRSLEQGISWRAYRRLDHQHAAAVDEAHHTKPNERTAPQQRALFDAQWQTQKMDNRLNNINRVTGRAHTSNGVSVFINGTVRK